MIQDEQELFVDSPWDCRGLDPFRDDPVETNNISLVKDKSEDVGCTRDNNQNCPCTCGKCIEMRIFVILL